MISFEHVLVEGWQAAIRGMRNPMNSWTKSDSLFSNPWDYDLYEDKNTFRNICDGWVDDVKNEELITHTMPTLSTFSSSEAFLGKNDIDLMKRLASAGSVHAKYRRMINVTMDITAPLYWWKEFDTYKVGTVSNSCSTMHKIHAKKFTLEDFSYEHLIPLNAGNLEDVPTIPIDKGYLKAPLDILKMQIDMLNVCRERYLKTKDKMYWWQMIQLLPSSYNQRRTVKMNYEVLSSIYKYRKDHKLDEWHGLCKLIRVLPLSVIITGEEDENGDV